MPAQPLTLTLEPQNTMQIHIERKHNILPTYICIGWRTCSIYHKDRNALDILRTVLSGPLNARLFTLLREENGVTYKSDADTFYAEHTGDFKITATCDSSKVFRNRGHGLGVFPLIIQLVKDLTVTQAELDAVKTYLHGAMTLDAEDSDTIAESNAEQFLFNKPYIAYKDKYSTCIEPVKLKDVNACIKRHLRPENMVISIVSNNAEALRKTNYEKIVAKILN
jgi:predicted Zn-dependent peptidase